VDLADLIAPDRVILRLQVSSKSHLLADLSRRAATATGLPQKQIADALEARERLGSTGVGAGIALPHAQLAGLGAFYGLFARLDRPLDYDAIDGRPVDLVFLLLIPANATEHLQALAAIARRLRDTGTAAALRAATTAPEMHAALTHAR